MKRSDQIPSYLKTCREFNLGRLRWIILQSLKIIKKLHLLINGVSHVRDIDSIYIMVEITTHDSMILSRSYFLGNKIGS